METVLLKSDSKIKMASLIKIAKDMGIDVVKQKNDLDKIDDEIGFPGSKIPKKKFEAWLVSEDEVEYGIDEAFAMAKKEVIKNRKPHK